ncbi:anion permease [Natronosalvus hydrolyticus]|uniref:anion permease n=1 Tax=Natronosalvus hydrolyticus TaxID=2979988 RepID=UPI00319DEA80
MVGFPRLQAREEVNIPVLAALAAALAIHPYLLMVVATTVASFAFMLPVATPPNAVVFGSGYITVPQMARTGFLLNLVGVVLAVLFALLWLPIAWDIDPGTVPPWFG